MTGELRARWVQRFARLGAEGIDFMSCVDRPENAEIYASYKKEDFLILDDYAYPRSLYLFWKIIFGKKVYMIEEKKK